MISVPVGGELMVAEFPQQSAPSGKKGEKAEILLQHARQYGRGERDKAIELYTRAVEHISDPFYRGAILDTIGLLNLNMGYIQEAGAWFERSLEQFTGLGDSLWLGRLHNNLAVVHARLGERNEALENYREGLRIREATGDLKGVAKIHNNIGLIYQDWGLWDQAREHHDEALKIATNLGDDNTLAYTYSCLGNWYKATGRLEEALEHFRLGMEANAVDDSLKAGYSFYLTDIGQVFAEMGNPDSAISCFNRSIHYARLMNSDYRLAMAGISLAMVYLDVGKADSARKYAELSYSLSLRNNYPGLRRDNLFLLAGLEEKAGRTGRAYAYYKEGSELKDSMINSLEIAGFTELQIRYNLEQQERENALLRKDLQIQQLQTSKERQIKWILGFLLLLILAALYLVNRNRASLKKLSMRLQESEKELQLSNKQKDTFISIISHDLKSPFSGMMGLIHLLDSRLEELSRQEIQNHVKALQESSTGIYALLEGLLEWARTQAGKVKYNFVSADLHQVAGRVTELMKAGADEKELVLVNEIPAGTLAEFDINAIETVFRNLIGNAVKFTGPGGFITVSAATGSDSIRVAVTDTGTGMAGGDAEKLFRIDTLHTTRGTRGETGTGLGLVLCKEIIEKHHGSIWVESTPGEGSRFHFTLPFAKQTNP